MSVSKLENNGAKVEVGSDGSIDATCQAFRVNGSPVGGGLIKSATVTLTDAQIRALPSGDFEVIPSVTSSQLIVPVAGVISTHIVTPYTNVLNDLGVTGLADALVWFRLGGSPLPMVALVPVLTDADDHYQLLTPIGSFNTVPKTTFADLPGSGVSPTLDTGVVSGADVDLRNVNVQVPLSSLMRLGDAMDLHVSNGALGNFTGGDPLNTLKVTVLYSVLDV